MFKTGLITSRANGLGHEVCRKLGGEWIYLSRQNGHDIRNSESRSAIAHASLSAELFINYAHSGDFSQTQLLYEVFSRWKLENKAGWLINIGSYATYSKQDTWRAYAAIKVALDVANRQCSKEIEATNLKMRMCNLRLGRIDAGKNIKSTEPRLDAGVIATAIRFLINLPESTILPELVLAPVGVSSA
jgi:hypothetical protein